MSNPRTAALTGVILTAALMRLLPHPWNVTPVAAMALFAGARLENPRTAYAIPLLAMLVSDAVLGFHAAIPFVYAAFLATVALGRGLAHRPGAGRVLGSSVVASLLFFFLTNAGHWLVTPMYPKTGAGLAACFGAALPFFRNTLLGDLGYAAAFFGGFALAERLFPRLRPVAVTA